MATNLSSRGPMAGTRHNGRGRKPTRAMSGGRRDPIKEIIGRVSYARPNASTVLRTFDKTQPDYAFWDMLRRGDAIGYEFGGLFVSPLLHIIASNVMGPGIEAITLTDEAAEGQPESAVENTNQLLAELTAYLNAILYDMLVDLYGLGDQHMVQNPDGSLARPSPDGVLPEYMLLDYRRLEKVTLHTVLDDRTVDDVYTATQRSVVTRYNGKNDAATRVETQTYPVLIGEVPVTHFACDRGGNEVYGRPVAEALLRLLSRYDDLMEKGVDGAELSGNPIPTITGARNPRAVKLANAPVDDETYYDIDGNQETRDVINIDTRLGVVLGEGADFKLVHAGNGFSNDIRGMLKMLFYLLLDHTRVPEALWGGAINSSKASADAQMPPFYTYISTRRGMLEGIDQSPAMGLQPVTGLKSLITKWLLYKQLLEPRGVIVGATAINWPRLGDVDYEISRKWVEMMFNAGGITVTRMVQLSKLVDDAEQSVQEAKDEQAEAPDYDDFDQRLRDAMRNLERPDNGAEGPQEAQEGAAQAQAAR